jgi:hypothetical protein
MRTFFRVIVESAWWIEIAYGPPAFGVVNLKVHILSGPTTALLPLPQDPFALTRV